MSTLSLTGEEERDDAPPSPEPPEKPKRSRRSRKSSSSPRPKGTSEAELRKRIEDGLSEVIAFVEANLGWDDVATVMREDRSRMAEVLAARASKHARLGRLLARVFGKDSALSIARAFGPTLRAVGNHLAAWRAERAGVPAVFVDGEGWVLDPETGQRTGERAEPA